MLAAIVTATPAASQFGPQPEALTGQQCRCRLPARLRQPTGTRYSSLQKWHLPFQFGHEPPFARPRKPRRQWPVPESADIAQRCARGDEISEAATRIRLAGRRSPT